MSQFYKERTETGVFTCPKCGDKSHRRTNLDESTWYDHSVPGPIRGIRMSKTCIVKNRKQEVKSRAI